MIKTILVPATGLECDAAALETAFIAGRLFDAHIDCLHVRPDWVQLAAMTAPDAWGSGVISADVFESVQDSNKMRRDRAREAFVSFRERRNLPSRETPHAGAISASWAEVEGEEAKRIAAEGRFHDLVVLSRPSQTTSLDIGGVVSVLMSAGRPILLAPAKAPENLAPTIAIAWKDTPESARAVTAAMPFIEKAARVFVLAAAEGQDKSAAIESARNLVAQLAWHGVRAEAHHISADMGSVPEAVLDAAEGRGADLVVMGGYGHTRVGEFVFGGFTRYVLQHSPLPVFLFH